MTRRCRAPIDSNDSKNVTDPPQRGMIDNDELANKCYYAKQQKEPIYCRTVYTEKEFSHSKKIFRRGRNILHVHDIQKYVAIRYDIFPLLKKPLQEGEDFRGSGEEGRW